MDSDKMMVSESAIASFVFYLCINIAGFKKRWIVRVWRALWFAVQPRLVFIKASRSDRAYFSRETEDDCTECTQWEM